MSKKQFAVKSRSTGEIFWIGDMAPCMFTAHLRNMKEQNKDCKVVEYDMDKEWLRVQKVG